MGRTLIPSLEWLQPNNPEQLRWAAGYLISHGIIERHELPEAYYFNTHKLHEELMKIGNRFSANKKLFKDMKSAWSQKKSRERGSSRKTSSFTLTPEATKRLKELAGDGSASAILETLINKAYEANLRKNSKSRKGKMAAPQDSRNHALTEICTTLIARHETTQKPSRHPKKALATGIVSDHPSPHNQTAKHSIASQPEPIEKTTETQSNDNTASQDKSTNSSLYQQNHESEKPQENQNMKTPPTNTSSEEHTATQANRFRFATGRDAILELYRNRQEEEMRSKTEPEG